MKKFHRRMIYRLIVFKVFGNHNYNNQDLGGKAGVSPIYPIYPENLMNMGQNVWYVYTLYLVQAHSSLDSQ